MGTHGHQVSPTGTFLKSSKNILGSSFQPCRELYPDSMLEIPTALV